MKYRELIKKNEEFQYAVNLQYDLNNIHKVNSYIASRKAVEILKEYLLNIYTDNKDRANVLIGAYGKGKSHLLLVLLSLLSYKSEEDKKIIKKLINKISLIDEECGMLVKEISKSKKLVPVLINSNSLDLNQAFLVAIKDALDNYGLSHLLPKTYFDVAVDTIDKWKREYPTTYRLLEQELEKVALGLDVENFRKLLRKCNNQAYETFKNLYPTLTSGGEFNPLINTNVVKLYEEVAHILLDSDEGYTGLYIVFDEFSKFIEAGISLNTSKDLKIIQDFAELANRSGKAQIHLTCITHKTINEYISKLPKERLDAWKAIEGRFKEIYFTSSSKQNYELITNAILKNKEKLNLFFKENIDFFKYVEENSYYLFKDIYDKKEFMENIIKGSFPLNPYTTFALPKISEKIAQNERTLFTFLCKSDKNSLSDFIKANDGQLELLNLDRLYDYFEVLFKKETFNENISGIYMKASTAISCCSDMLEQRVLKTLAIIYIINDFLFLAPNNNNLRLACGLSINEYKNVMENLKDKGLVIYRKSSGYVDFIPRISVDLDKKINDLTVLKIKNINVAREVNSINKEEFILPRRYNDEYTITRFFKKVFISYDEFLAYNKAEDLLKEYMSDGLIINIIYFEKGQIGDIRRKLIELNDKRILVAVSQDVFTKEMDIKKYLAINKLLEDKKFLEEDALIESNLNILKEDILEDINLYLTENYNLENSKCKLVVLDKEFENVSKKELSKTTSDVCFELFSKTPKINNELINKNEISTPLLKARNSIVNTILSKEYLDEKNYLGTSVESTLFRTTIKNKGIISGEIDKDLENALKEIRIFFKECESEAKSFKDLYDVLTTSVKGIGMRLGVLPIFIAYTISNIKDEVVLYLGGRNLKEVELDFNLLNDVNKNPKKYLAKVEIGTKEKEDYINGLREIFSDYIDNKKYNSNRYTEILKAMQVWIKSLSQYSRTHNIKLNGEDLEDDIKKLRKSTIKFDINAREFLFKDISKILKINELSLCLERIRDIKNYLNNFDDLVKADLIVKIKKIFNNDYEGSLVQGFKIWINELSSRQREYLYDNAVNKVLSIDLNDSNDIELVDKLSYIATNLNIEDWNDGTLEVCIKELYRIKNTVQEFTDEIAIERYDNLVKISIGNNNDLSDEKIFNINEVDGIAITLLNNIEEVIDEYGGAVSDEDKRSILVKILEKYM